MKALLTPVPFSFARPIVVGRRWPSRRSSRWRAAGGSAGRSTRAEPRRLPRLRAVSHADDLSDEREASFSPAQHTESLPVAVLGRSNALGEGAPGALGVGQRQTETSRFGCGDRDSLAARPTPARRPRPPPPLPVRAATWHRDRWPPGRFRRAPRRKGRSRRNHRAARRCGSRSISRPVPAGDRHLGQGAGEPTVADVVGRGGNASRGQGLERARLLSPPRRSQPAEARRRAPRAASRARSPPARARTAPPGRGGRHRPARGPAPWRGPVARRPSRPPGWGRSARARSRCRGRRFHRLRAPGARGRHRPGRVPPDRAARRRWASPGCRS